jgi:hypothetical protein
MGLVTGVVLLVLFGERAAHPIERPAYHDLNLGGGPPVTSSLTYGLVV